MGMTATLVRLSRSNGLSDFRSMRGYHSNGACAVFLMISERINSEALDQLTYQLSAARVRLILQPGAIPDLDNADRHSPNFTGDRRRQSCYWTAY